MIVQVLVPDAQKVVLLGEVLNTFINNRNVGVAKGHTDKAIQAILFESSTDSQARRLIRQGIFIVFWHHTVL